MSAVALNEIERRLDELSLDEQLRLLARLATRIRRQSSPAPMMRVTTLRRWRPILTFSENYDCSKEHEE
jgi:hypothetical protein